MVEIHLCPWRWRRLKERLEALVTVIEMSTDVGPRGLCVRVGVNNDVNVIE
ncbi:hypothetical protein [Halobellus sp. Atlit-38R]|uniref:hypothetical protein n=1 Tax=Halobellus sp. Atlit-38R TaxID=2282131 RepID=UPI001314A9CA|nr:hypothetical protein [Halobellus sp. Atlit-38R]